MSNRDINPDPSILDAAGELHLAVTDSDGADTEEPSFAPPGQNSDHAPPSNSSSTSATESKDDPAASEDNLLLSLRDETVQDGEEDALETPAHLETWGKGGIFLLTEIDIGDLISDYDQVWAPDLGSEVKDLDQLVTQTLALYPGGSATVTIEIEDDAGIIATHIVS